MGAESGVQAWQFLALCCPNFMPVRMQSFQGKPESEEAAFDADSEKYASVRPSCASIEPSNRNSKRGSTNEPRVSIRDRSSIRSTSGVTLDFKSTPFGSGCFIPDTYQVPMRLLAEIFTSLDQRDSPSQPGRVKFRTAQGAILKFHRVVGCAIRDATVQEDMQDSLADLYEQAEARATRTGVSTPNEALIRWDQDLVLNCFRVKLPRMERVFFTLDISENSTLASKSVSCVVMTAVVVSVLTFILGTLPEAKENFSYWVPYTDLLCVTIFSLDYCARLLTVPFARMELLDREFMEDVLCQRRERELLARAQRLFRFLWCPMGLVDLASVIPFWVELAIGGMEVMTDEDSKATQQTKALKIFRMARMFRILKLGSLTKVDLGEDRNMVLTLFTSVISKAWPALQLVVALIGVALVLFGTMIWYSEKGELFQQDDPACPHPGICREGAINLRQFPDGTYEKTPSPFSSIPMSFWWVLVTITTVGYGDMYPITPFGYTVGSMTILYGSVVFALPVGVIGTTFSQAFDQFRSEQTLRKLLSEQAAAGDSPELSMETVEYNETPPLVSEFQNAVQNCAMSIGLPMTMAQRWEEKLKRTVKFENLSIDHPCESLERWGAPVIAALREHANQHPLGGAALTLALGAWYRLLLHTSMAYEEFRTSQDRVAFDRAFRGPLRSAKCRKTFSPKTFSPGDMVKSTTS